MSFDFIFDTKKSWNLMTINPNRFFLAVTLLYLLFFSNLKAQNKPLNRPKLVVGIVVDQMRYDYLSRFWNKYGEDGFKKLVRNGFNCKNTHYNYVPTYTGPGHASIYTGCSPSVHGIIANNWYSRELNRMVYCTEQNDKSKSGNSEMGPQNLLSTTITDELKLFSNFRSKVIGISIKDRGAILPAGHAGDAAYWLDKKTGNWQSSAHYLKELPEWVNSFNKKKLSKNYLDQTWSTLLPIESYTESIVDSNRYEKSISKTKAAVFPYDLKTLSKGESMDLIAYTPFGNDYTRDFAIETIKAEKLGKNEYTDFLSISFSSTDYIGHQFGPQSIEVEDTYLRLDKTIESLLNFIEQELGKDSCLIFLTADHGGAYNSGYLRDRKINAGYLDSEKLLQSTKAELKNQFGEGDFITSFSNEQIYLNQQLIGEKKIKSADVKAVISSVLMGQAGVAGVYSSDDLIKNAIIEKPAKLLQMGYHQKRSGDIAILLEPGWMNYEEQGSTHGAPYTYDTHVPLIWYGWKIKQGQSADYIEITDIAPTLSTLLEISMPNGCTGKSQEMLITK
jgi:predicted AlkP superfamily pyrophosphatase or phosphodiesterase